MSSSAPPHSAELFVQVGATLSPTCSKHGAPMLPTFNLRGRFVFFEKCFVLLQMVHFQHALAWFRLKRRYALLFSFFFFVSNSVGVYSCAFFHVLSNFA